MSLFDTLIAMGGTVWYQLVFDPVNKINDVEASINGMIYSTWLSNRQQCGNFKESAYIYNVDTLPSTEFTICVWISIDSTVATNYYTIYDSSSLDKTIYTRIQLDTTNKLSVKLRNGATNATLTYNTALITDTWYQVVLTYTANNVKLYINGNNVTSNTTMTLNTVNQTYNSIGCQAVDRNNIFTGYMKNLFIFSKVLDSKQIQKLYYLTYIE